MILKYQTGDTWGFIDNVRQAAHTGIDIDNLVRQYDDEKSKMPCENGYQDPAEYLNGNRLSEEVIKSNKAFCAATELPDEGINRHSENHLDPNILDMPA
jgi:hypothetical protein